MKKLAFLLFCFGIFQLSHAQNSTPPGNGPEGMWKCSAPDAPYQYQVFNVQINKVNDIYTGKIVGDGGMEMPLNDVTFKDRTLEMGLFVEGTPVKMKFKYDGAKLKGVAITDQGEIGVTAERLEATEKKAVVADSIQSPKK